MPHAQLDNMLVVSYAGAPKSAAPANDEAFVGESQAAYFTSRNALEHALEDDASYTVSQLASMSINDLIFAARQFLEGGGEFTSLAEALPGITEDAGDPTDEVEPWGAVWLNTTSGDVFQSTGDGNWTQIST